MRTGNFTLWPSFFCALSMFPKATADTFSTKLYCELMKHPRFEKPKLSQRAFTIDHYAGKASRSLHSPFAQIPSSGGPLRQGDQCFLSFSLAPIPSFLYSCGNSFSPFLSRRILLPFTLSFAILPNPLSFQVTYDAEKFLEKNKDYVVAEHQDLLSVADDSFVAGLFPVPDSPLKNKSKFTSLGSGFKVGSRSHCHGTQGTQSQEGSPLLRSLTVNALNS